MPAPLYIKTCQGDLDFNRDHTYIMAVINLSLDSHQKHTIAHSPDEALAMARRYREAGAEIIDIGAQSSNYVNKLISAEEEIEHLLPSLRLLADDGFIVSVDTWKPAVAEAALHAGAAIINDTGGLTKPAMVQLIKQFNCPVIPVYIEADNPLEVGEVKIETNKAGKTLEALKSRLRDFHSQGIDQLIIDPGIAINYRVKYEDYTRQQLAVIRDIPLLKSSGYPVLIPIPRKPITPWVYVYISLALENKANLIRVHDVEVACQMRQLYLPEALSTMAES